MPTAGLVRTHRASIVSDAVPRRIERAASGSLEVQSVYRSTLNIRTTDGLLTIASPAVGGLPNGILADLGADWRTIGVAPGMAVTATDSEIRVPDAGLVIRIASAPRWSPRLRAAGWTAEVAPARWRRRAPLARSLVLARAPADGLGGLLTEAARDGTVDAARPRVARLAGALQAVDRRAAADASTGLIGLGPGLTPSGDDYLVGVEAALRAVAHPSAGFLALAVADVEARTTELAATLLRHAAAGEFAERLHALTATLLRADDEAIPAAIERAVAWGATSGVDCLVGVMLGLDVAAGAAGRAGAAGAAGDGGTDGLAR